MLQIEEWLYKLRVAEGLEGKKHAQREPSTRPLGISLSWLLGFMKRTPSIKLAPARVIEEERAENSTRDEIDHYFDLLVNLFKKNDYDWSMVANFDETYLIWGCDRFKVLTRSTNKVGIVKEVNVSEHLTLCATIFADGTSLHPLVILPKVNLPKEINFDDFPCFDWTGQKNGWIDKAIFDQYCREVVIPEFNRRAKKLPRDKRHGLLIVDGHNSRVNAELMQHFKDNNIDVLVLPAHTSHITQPLDLCFFCVFKRRLHPLPEHKNAATAAEKRIALLTAAQLSFQISSATYYINKSFERAGVKPLNRNRILDSDCILRSAPSAFPLPEIAPKKKNGRTNINNCVLTDRVEELREDETERAAVTNSKKRKSTSDNSEDSPTPKRNVPAPLPQNPHSPVLVEKFDSAALPTQCCLCQRPPTTTSQRTWTQCDQCDDTWICQKHPLGMQEHYRATHPNDDIPGRKRRANLNKYMDDFLMEIDED